MPIVFAVFLSLVWLGVAGYALRVAVQVLTARTWDTAMEGWFPLAYGVLALLLGLAAAGIELILGCDDVWRCRTLSISAVIAAVMIAAQLVVLYV